MHWRIRGSGTRLRLLDDALEQLRIHRAIGGGRHRLARLCQLGVAGIVEGGSRAARLLEPSVEIAGRTDLATNRISEKPSPL